MTAMFAGPLSLRLRAASSLAKGGVIATDGKSLNGAYGNAVTEFQEPPKELAFGASELGHFRAVLRTAQHCQKRDQQDFDQICQRVMIAIAFGGPPKKNTHARRAGYGGRSWTHVD
jgi:hypothetical protein